MTVTKRRAIDGTMAAMATILVGVQFAVADVEWKWDESQHTGIPPAIALVNVAAALPNTVQTVNAIQFDTYAYNWLDSPGFGFHARKPGLAFHFR